MLKWEVEPIYTGKNIYDYAESHFNKRENEMFNTHEQAKKRAEEIKATKGIDCNIVEKEVEIEVNTVCSFMQSIV